MPLKFAITFEKSCSALSDLPSDGIREVALIGRSNVGKSSLLNALAANPSLARTSRTPGRTRLLNLFSVNDGQLRLVDCPGYGYAVAAKDQRLQWGELVEAYLSRGEQLSLVLLLIDGRIEPQPLDVEMATWLRRHGRTLQCVATKCDRLSGNERPAARRRLEAAFAAPVLPCSASTGEGIAAVQRLLSPAGRLPHSVTAP